LVFLEDSIFRLHLLKKIATMKTFLSFSFLFMLCITNPSIAQQQLENGNLELWENVGTATEEPVNWSSLKTADALASTAPQVVSRDAGRNGGFCAKLEVKSVFGIPANGMMTNGRVHADFNPENGYVYTEPNNSEWHTLFSSRPDSIVGWYKYAPQQNDKGKVEVILHVNQGRLPFNGFEQNLIGRARHDIIGASADWKRFSTPFYYYNGDTPQYVLITVAAGDSTISKNGTLLWIDDLELIYNQPAAMESQNMQEIAVNASAGFIHFDDQVSGSYHVLDMKGQRIQYGSISKQIAFQHPAGIYIISGRTDEGLTFRRKLYITH
jgi:hypothetical protein